MRPMKTMHIYPRVLRMLKARAWIGPHDTVLVLGAGHFDEECLAIADVENVTFSNLGSDQEGITALDAEAIALADGSFDWVVIHAALHHLAIPALGVCEMFRVARKGILCFEARDSLLVRLAVRVGLTESYELEPAFLSGGADGGYRNGPIPNFVYRWTEREFEKVVNSFAPAYRHKFFYAYGFSVPVHRFAMARSRLFRAIGVVLAQLAGMLELVAARQGNQFAFGALKNASMQPWLTDDLKFRDDFMSGRYDKANYCPLRSRKQLDDGAAE